MQKILLFIVIAGLILPTLPVARAFSPPLVPPVPSSSAHNAVIISSLDDFSPMRRVDIASINRSLTQAGYTVTYLKDGAVTLNLITTQLNNYEVIIWRTDAYEQAHTLYWYIGEIDNPATEQAYASDFTSGWLDGSHGILGASAGFFSNHFNTHTLANVKLMILVSSMSSVIAGYFVGAGARSVIEFSNTISLQFNWIDYLVSIIVRFLAAGYDVADAVSGTIVPLLTMILEDPLDSMQIPSVSCTGDYTVTIV